MVVKHHQNRHKIHRRCTFIHSIHNWKYFCEPTFIYVHIGQDGIIVLNLTLSLALNGSESPLKVKIYRQNYRLYSSYEVYWLQTYNLYLIAYCFQNTLILSTKPPFLMAKQIYKDHRFVTSFNGRFCIIFVKVPLYTIKRKTNFL